jgi:glycine/D-amino acid oxidase-like deaminating enzyme
MTASARGDVVIVGGGIVGMVTAYYLAKAGVPSVVIERDAIGSHASGYAYGGLSPGERLRHPWAPRGSLPGGDAAAPRAGRERG